MEDETKTKRDEILAKARGKAAELRKKKAEEKAQQLEIQKQIQQQLENPTAPIPIPTKKKEVKEVKKECQFKGMENVKEDVTQEELENPAFVPQPIEEKKKKKKKKQIIVLQNSSDSDSDSSTEQIIIRQKRSKNKERKTKEEDDKKPTPVFDQQPKLDEVENELLKRQYKEQLDKMRFDALKNFLVPQSNWRK